MNFLNKLSKVFKLFLNLKKPVSDDTSLYRLLDFIQISFTEKPDETGRLLVEFLKSVVDDIKSVEPSIVTFALSLCGIMVKDSTFYTTHHTLVSRLYHTVHKQMLTTDPSIGTEYFKSLTVVCQNLKWISFEDCTQEHIQEAYNTLKVKGSLFHQSAARQFLVTTITNKYSAQANMPEPHVYLETLAKTLVDDLMKCLLECTANGVAITDMTPHNILELWVDILKVCPSFSHLLMEDLQNIVELLLKISFSGPKHLQSTSENLSITLLNCCPPEDRNMIMTNMVIPWFEGESLHINFLDKHRLAIKMQKGLQLSGEILTKLKTISNLPLKFLFDASHLSKYQLETVGENVTKKSTFLKLLSQTVDVAALEAENHELVIDLLASTDDNSNTILLKSPQTIQLIGNTKLQLKLMSVITQLTATGELQEASLSRAVDVTLNLLSQAQVDPKVYQVGQTCLLCELSAIASHDGGSVTQCFPRLTVLLEKRLVDTRWEVRDTTIDGIKQLVTNFKDNNTVLQRVAASSLIKSAWRCHTDTDSYVRASAFSLISEITKYPQVWNPFVAEKDCQEDTLVNTALDILSTDSEAFARRATVEFLHSMYHHHKTNLTDKSVRTLITGVSLAIADFDWEVKTKVLQFIKTMFDNIRRPSSETHRLSSKDSLPEYAVELCTNMKADKAELSIKKTFTEQMMYLAELGCLDALHDGFHDFDQTVQKEAYTILLDVKKSVTDSAELSELSSGAMTSKDKDLGLEKAEVSSSEALTKFLQFLKGVDFEAKARELSSSVDEYVRNPVSLLDDILSAEFVEDPEENMVDCY